MICRNPECRAEIPEGALFCGKCSTPVNAVCLVCGKSLPARKCPGGACPNCGTLIREMRMRAAEKNKKSEGPSRVQSSGSKSGSAPVREEPYSRTPPAPPRPDPVREDSESSTVPVRRDSGSVYSSPVYVPPEPYDRIRTDRSIGMYILLTLISFGIYGIVFMTKIGKDINRIASKYDRQETMHYCLALILSLVTFGIYGMVWYHKLSDRVGRELERRGFAKTISSSTYWLWYFLGSLVIIGPFIYMHRLICAMNTLAKEYNICG